MIALPMIIMFLLGAVFGIWVFNPILRKYVLAQISKNDSEKDSAES